MESVEDVTDVKAVCFVSFLVLESLPSMLRCLVVQKDLRVGYAVLSFPAAYGILARQTHVPPLHWLGSVLDHPEKVPFLASLSPSVVEAAKKKCYETLVLDFDEVLPEVTTWAKEHYGTPAKSTQG